MERTNIIYSVSYPDELEELAGFLDKRGFHYHGHYVMDTKIKGESNPKRYAGSFSSPGALWISAGSRLEKTVEAFIILQKKRSDTS